MSIRSIRAAVAFLTIIPVAGKEGEAGSRLGRAYFPAVGAVVGVGAAVVLVLLSAFTSQLVGAAAAIAVIAALTGGLHLDGLADAADGLFGGRSREQRLEFMRDPRVGSFGVSALVLVLLLDVALLSSTTPVRAAAALVVAGGLSRWAMLWLVAVLPYARVQGLGTAAAGGYRVFDLVLATVITALVCLIDWRRAALGALFAAIVALSIAIVALRRLGGATGDIYGATVETCQLAVFLAFAIRL